MTKFIIMILYQFVLSLLFVCSANAQIAAAGWCVMQSSDQQSDQSSNQPPNDSFPPQQDESESASLGCDIGIGFSLYTHNRLALVAVVGSESIGSGVAWIINPHKKSETVGQLWQ